MCILELMEAETNFCGLLYDYRKHDALGLLDMFSKQWICGNHRAKGLRRWNENLLLPQSARRTDLAFVSKVNVAPNVGKQ